MPELTTEDWSDQIDKDLRKALVITLMAVSDPLCDPTVVDDLMAFVADIRAELARRTAAGVRQAPTRGED